MGRARIYTACRDCKRCTNSPIANSGRKAGRATIAFTTVGLSEVGFAMRKKCSLCGHQMSLHRGSVGALPVQVVGPVEVQSHTSKAAEPQLKQKMTNGAVRLTDEGWPMMEPLPKREASLLAGTLTQHEIVLGQLIGQFHQSAVATNQRLIILKSGLMADYGNKITSFDYQNITSIEVSVTLTVGYFEITAGGMAAPTLHRTEKSLNRHHLPNVVPFVRSERKQWDLFAGKVREMSSVKASPLENPKVEPSGPSIPEMIAQLAQLHEAGILSDQEFAEKKADLLSRL